MVIGHKIIHIWLYRRKLSSLTFAFHYQLSPLPPTIVSTGADHPKHYQHIVDNAPPFLQVLSTRILTQILTIAPALPCPLSPPSPEYSSITNSRPCPLPALAGTEEYPNEWQAHVDESSGYTYYWNPATNEVSWEPPVDLSTLLQPPPPPPPPPPAESPPKHLLEEG